MNALEKIVESKRMPILFIGSGISKRYLHNYPNWEELLKNSFDIVFGDSYQYEKYKDSLKRSDLSKFDIYVKLGTIIENKFNEAFYDRKINFRKQKKTPNWVRAGVSPYKMYIVDKFKKIKLYRDSNLHEELQEFKKLKNKTLAVITTNYDKFLETEIFNDDYKVFVNQNDLFSSNSYNVAEIYKIHGCISDANSIVITENDYKKFKQSRKLIIAKMLTLFAEAPIVFLGYSFTDKNIKELIIEFLSCLSHKNLEDIHEHFIFISYTEGEHGFKEIIRTVTTDCNKEIPITEIRTDNFKAVYETLNGITPGASARQIRDLKKLVKTIVVQSTAKSDPEAIVVGIDSEDIESINYDTNPIAIAVGEKSVIKSMGYGMISIVEIMEDILFDNKNFSSELMCTKRFASISYTHIIPIFKYIKKARFVPSKESRLEASVKNHNSVDKILSARIRKTLMKIPEITNYDALIEQISMVETLNKKAGVLLKNIKNFNADDIRRICCELFNAYKDDLKSIKESTNFKRCILYLDFIENGDFAEEEK